MKKAVILSMGILGALSGNVASANCGNTIPGSYQGINDAGEACSVTIEPGGRFSNGGGQGSICIAKAVYEGSEFGLLAAAATADGIFRTRNYFDQTRGKTVRDDEAGELRVERDVLIFEQGNGIVERKLLANVYTFTPTGRKILVERNRVLDKSLCYLN